MRRVLAVVVVAAGFVVAGGASAMLSLNFGGISNNDGTGTNSSTGTSQLQIDILDGGGGLRGVGGTVSFVITNLGPNQSTITDIFFMDPGLLAAIVMIDNSVDGVEYMILSNQNNLPGGGAVGFFATEGLTAEPTTPPAHHGVDPGEFLTIVFSLESNATFADILNALGDESLRIGLHVQNFEDDGSESFVNMPPIPLPVPMLAGFAGLCVLGARRSRRSIC